MRGLRFWVLTLVGIAMVAGTAVASELTSDQEARYRHMIQELRCLVCQNQTIADSDAPLAQDLRAQVRNQILAGESDSDIKSYLTDRYGDFVLYNPPLKASTLVLWLGPVFLVVIALFMALMFVRRSKTKVAASPVDKSAVQRLLDETRK